MLSRGAAPRPAVAAPPPSEGYTVEDLTVPEHAIADEGVRSLILLAQRVQQMRVQVYSHFDDAFERLVTVGDAAGYPPCVERFKPKFAACDDDLERIAVRLDALRHAPIGALTRNVVRSERLRFAAKCEEQVLRQRLSLVDLESDERPALKQQVQAASSGLAQLAASVEEALEELRAEAADADDED